MSPSEREKPPPGCPICGKPRDARYAPFCSKRCADVDLNRWLGGRYAIPADDQSEVEDGPSDSREAPHRRH